jgi:hypothetical protein
VTRSVDSCGVSDADAAGVGNDPERVVGIGTRDTARSNV